MNDLINLSHQYQIDISYVLAVANQSGITPEEINKQVSNLDNPNRIDVPDPFDYYNE